MMMMMILRDHQPQAPFFFNPKLSNPANISISFVILQSIQNLFYLFSIRSLPLQTYHRTASSALTIIWHLSFSS